MKEQLSLILVKRFRLYTIVSLIIPVYNGMKVIQLDFLTFGVWIG
jgi:hypothetical protein